MTQTNPAARRGRFIVVEGTDGAGKSTQVDLLAARLDAFVTHEPGDTPLGARLRELLLSAELELDDRTEALLMAADRAEHVATVLRPMLDTGRDVICSRFTWSSLAYQGAGRGLDVADLAAIDSFARAGLTPDMTLMFDLDPAISAERIGSRGTPDRIEAAGNSFQARVRAAMLDLAAREPNSAVIDASGTRAEVHQRTIDALVRHGIMDAPPAEACSACGGYGWVADPLPSGEPDPATHAECPNLHCGTATPAPAEPQELAAAF